LEAAGSSQKAAGGSRRQERGASREGGKRVFLQIWQGTIKGSEHNTFVDMFRLDK